MRLHRYAPIALITLALTAFAFASGERYARIGIVGATDLPTMPRADRMVILREGTDFVVPDGMRFVLRGVGLADESDGSTQRAVFVSTVEPGNATTDLWIRLGGGSSGEPAWSSEVPIGWSYGGGTVVRVEDRDSQDLYGRAWGYLELSY